jgi:hypothetical protein
LTIRHGAHFISSSRLLIETYQFWRIGIKNFSLMILGICSFFLFSPAYFYRRSFP